MRLSFFIVFVFFWTRLLSQPVLTMTDAQRSVTVAPYAYYLEDFTHKFTYEQVAKLPLTAFKPVNRQGAIQLGMRLGIVWLRFRVNNQTERELVLLSTWWKFIQLDVYVVDATGKLTIQKLASQTPVSQRIAPIAQAFSLLGKRPRTVHLAARLDIADFYNDYLQLTDMGYAIGSVLLGHPYPLMRIVTHWLGIEYVGYLAISLFLLLVSVVYVSIRDFQKVRWYAFAFSVGLITMIIAILALYDLSWISHYPYNNMYFLGSVVEILLLGFILAERVSEHRRQQSQTQLQLIDQLQENLRQRDKLLQIRDEIARDLHDEVGATLTSIAISTKLVQKKVNGQQSEVATILDQIQTDSQETITAIRDTVWVLNPDNDAPEKLLDRLRAVAHQLLANQNITLNVDNQLAAKALPPFSMEQRRNVYLIVKEALHNIAKHAQATRVDVRIFQDTAGLQILISDNGKGFDTHRQGEGNGLRNFQKRATEGGFAVTVDTAPEQGTVVALLIPVHKTEQPTASVHQHPSLTKQPLDTTQP